MPSSFSARVRPSLASWLNERSLRPPMSVTRPTLIFLAAGVDDDDALDPPDELESSPPQPATSVARPSVRTTSRCTARRDGTSFPSKEVMNPAKRRQTTRVTSHSHDLSGRGDRV